MFDRHNTGFLKSRNVRKHEVWHHKGITEMMWLARRPSDWWNTQVVYYSLLILFFCYYSISPLPPAIVWLCQVKLTHLLTVFVMNTFRDFPLCGTWWMRTVENALLSTIMLSPWPTLMTKCTSIFCILMRFESSPFKSWQVNAHPNKVEALRAFS